MAELGLDSKSLLALMATELLQPVLRCRMPGLKQPKSLLRHDVDAFTANYVSIDRLAQERGWSRERSRKWLRQAGVSPAFTPTWRGSRIFRRSEICDLGIDSDKR